MRLAFVLLVALFFTPGAYAYTGPGLGLGLIGTIFGVVFSVLLAFLAIFWYPLKRALKIGKNKPEHEDETTIEEEKQPATENISDNP